MGLYSFFKSLINIFFSRKHVYIGKVGEQLVFNILVKLYNENQIFRNLYIMRPNGKYTEIDLVSVDNSSIIVYESKNYSGWIFGRQSNPYWTQSFRTKKVKFYNPIMQNNTHINALKNYLSDFPLNYYSIIVFGKRCLLINLEYDLANTHVITRNKLKRTVKNILNSSYPSINDSQLKEVIERLSKAQKPNDNIVNKHLIDINTCPLCGSELIERTAYSSGYKFIGCKGFPKCKYTRKF